MLADNVFVFQGEFFRGGGLSFEAFVDFLDRVEVVVRAKQFAAFNAEGFGDDEGFVVHAIVEVEESVEFIGRQEVPKDDFAAGALEMGLGLAELFFDGGIEAAVDSANALHETDRIPVEIEVDEAVGVLEIETFGKNIGGDENVCGFLRRISAVVERSKSADNIAALLGGAGAINALNCAREVFAAELDFQVGSGVGEFSENDDFSAGKVFVFLEKFGEGG